MPTAAEVVRDYLDKQTTKKQTNVERDAIGNATAEVIAELPDTFTGRDVRACVALVLDGDETTKDVSTPRRSRLVNKELAKMTQNGLLSIDDQDVYTKQPF